MVVQTAPYRPEAFEFVRDGIGHTVAILNRATESGDSRHVSGQELCMGLCDLAKDRYGPLARAVLASWNVHRTEDFGRIVFKLVEAGLLSTTERDTLDDFRGVLDFDETFARQDVHSRVFGTN